MRIIRAESARQSRPGSYEPGGGKSGLHRVECQITSGGRKPTESAAESRPPVQFTESVRVKGCGKSAPRNRQRFAAR